MNTRRSLKGMLVLFCAMFVVLCVYLAYTVSAYGTRWFASPYNTRLDSRRGNVVAGDILDRSGVTLATTGSDGERVYAESSTVRKATAHAVGDSRGQTLGAESFYAQYLLGFNESLYDRMGLALSGQPAYGSNVVLSIDSALSATAYNALNGRDGAIVVMNYETGELLAAVSSPTFDPKYMDDYLSGKRSMSDSAMVNRVSSGRYTPGSVFKIVTATAALRYIPDILTRTFTCDGPLVFDPESGRLLSNVHISAKEDAQNRKTSEPGMSGEYLVVRDYNGEYHGEINFQAAFAKSCNHVFAALAVELGADRLSRTARELGVGEDFLFADIVSAMSSFVKGDTDADVAWSGVGQYKDIMTPLHMCLITSAIANGGDMMEPKLLLDVTDRQGASAYSFTSKAIRSIFTRAEADTLTACMVETVKSGTGRNARISGITVAGKTGTAETGAGESAPNAWFTGFTREHPLAICVVIEKGGSGGSNAAPVAATVLKKAIALELT